MTDKSFGKIIGYAILSLGYFEAIVGILQWVGIMHSHHYGYSFTGTFYNPGPYACFLSIMVPIAVSMMDGHNHRAERWVGMGMVLMCAILIPASLSRTAMIACATGTTIALWNSIYSYLRKIRMVYVILSAVVIIIAVSSLYVVKKDSADGRILMWKIAAETVLDAPITGVGWDNVVGEYGEAQERYFESGKATEHEIMVADSPEYVFNEYLQLAIAFGPLAAILVIAIFSWGIAVSFKNHDYGLSGSAVAIAVVLFASYPLQFTIFVITIGLVLTGCFLSAKSLWVKIFGIIITLCAYTLFLTNNSRTDVNTEFQIAHSLHRQGKYRKSNVILLELKKHSADPMILNIIGRNYQSLGKPDSAIHYLCKSTFRCPNRMYPHYLLMKLYDDSISFDRETGIHEASIILSMKPKVESEATGEMKREAALKLKMEK